MQKNSNYVGDILLFFHSGGEHFLDRQGNPGWQEAAHGEQWKLEVTASASGWKGYPLQDQSAEKVQVWLLGELYPPKQSFTEFVSLLDENDPGEKSYNNLNGHFLLLAWDGGKKQWHVWTDRFGTLHAYYATDGKRAALGTFFPAVAAAASQKQLDWEGLTGFFAFGFFPQDRTFFQDVRILRPATHYIFGDQGRLLSQERYWHWWHEPDPKRSYDATVAEFADLLQEVMGDLTAEGRVAFPISGGLDSRSTVAAVTRPSPAAAPSPRFWAYSYGYSDDSVETRIARQVAAARRLPFEAFTIKPYLFKRLDLVLGSVEGFQDVTQCRQAAVVDEVADRADYLIAAHWGDVWLDDMGLVGESPAHLSRDAVLRHAFKKMRKSGTWLMEHLCRPHLQGADPEALLLDLVRQEMAPFQHLEDPDFRVKAFKTDQWSFRWTTASLRMFQPGAFPRLPFYDTRVADFFCTVPSDFVRRRRLQIEYLKRYAPDLARIKWQVYDTNLFRRQYFHTWLLPKRALKKAWRLLTQKPILERNWEVQFLNGEGRVGLESWLLRPGLKLHEFVSPEALRAVLKDFFHAPFEQGRGYIVSMLLTFSAWLEVLGYSGI